MSQSDHSIFTEIMVWGLGGLLSTALALLILIAGQSPWWSPAVVDSQTAVSTLAALPLPVDNIAFTGAAFLSPDPDVDQSFINDLSLLSPGPELLAELSGREIEMNSFSLSAEHYDEMIETAARQHNVSPLLVKAIIQAESNFNPRAVSHKGAVGLMQVMPSTARSMGIKGDWADPQKNIQAGVRYLKQLLEQFNDDEKLAIAAYNCGPEALKRYNNQIPPYRETRSYVKRVLRYYNHHLSS